MKNLKAVLLTFLFCVFTVNICYGGWESEMSKVANLFIFLVICFIFYIINIILIVRKKWMPWVIFSSITFLVIDIILFLENQIIENEIDLFAIVYLVIFGFYLTQFYLSFKIIQKKNLKI